jgi:hypothetical protein
MQLDELFQKPVTSDFTDITQPKAQKVKVKENRMSWKNLGMLVVGAGAVGAVLYFGDKGHAKMTIEPYSGTIAKESTVLEKVHTYCFPLLEGMKDEATCKLWLKKYRTLDKYAYSDSDEETENVLDEAQAGEEKIEKLSESQAGNAQSPAN